jgi:hypothetical protein
MYLSSEHLLWIGVRSILRTTLRNSSIFQRHSSFWKMMWLADRTFIQCRYSSRVLIFIVMGQIGAVAWVIDRSWNVTEGMLLALPALLSELLVVGFRADLATPERAHAQLCPLYWVPPALLTLLVPELAHDVQGQEIVAPLNVAFPWPRAIFVVIPPVLLHEMLMDQGHSCVCVVFLICVGGVGKDDSFGVENMSLSSVVLADVGVSLRRTFWIIIIPEFASSLLDVLWCCWGFECSKSESSELPATIASSICIGIIYLQETSVMQNLLFLTSWCAILALAFALVIIWWSGAFFYCLCRQFWFDFLIYLSMCFWLHIFLRLLQLHSALTIVGSECGVSCTLYVWSASFLMTL